MKRRKENLFRMACRQQTGLPLLIAVGALSFYSLHAQQADSARRVGTGTVSSEGPALFARHCAACHGADGRGGDRAPDIVTIADVQQMSNGNLTAILRNGIPAAGMPAFGLLGTEKLQALIDQLRVLQGVTQGKSTAVQLPGDAHAGQLLFFGKAQCSACHMIGGKGGFIASDLSLYASTQVAANIRRVIIDPNNNLTPRAHGTTVVTNAGEKVTGLVKSSDNFSVTLQTLDGSFRSFERSDLKKIETASSAMMPDNYGSILSADELNDLISYLLSVAGENPVQNGDKKQQRWDDDN
jgi:putative heme-binding domain-containing protein